MTDLVTQCPRCSTRFRLDSAQLQAAGGIVRCGNCRALFRAAQPAQPSEAEPPAPSQSPSTAPHEAEQAQATPASPTSGEVYSPWIYHGVDLDRLKLDEQLATPERQHPAAEDDPQLAEGTRLPPRNELKLWPVTHDDPAPRSPLSADTRPIRDTLARRRREARVEPAIGDIGAPAAEAHRSDRPITVPQLPAAGTSDSLFDVEDEPLHLGWQPRRKPWGRWLGWSLLILIALLALAGQYVYYNLDELARQERYRPWLERICPLAGCTLPSRVDIEQIRSSNLVVRSHPEFNGALVVDAIIYNRAPFAQPFPLLEFSFADINGNEVASRSFKPGEYLSGELTGQQQMPSQVPIHISLDILDPGSRAVNYSLGFRSPD